MGHLHPSIAASLIKELCQSSITKEAEQQSKKMIGEMVLAQKIVDQILYADSVPVHFLEVKAEGSRVVLHGVATTQEAIEAAIESARSVSGVIEVASEIQLVQEYSVMP
jgi:osmotically-inducible protein OsmY